MMLRRCRSGRSVVPGGSHILLLIVLSTALVGCSAMRAQPSQSAASTEPSAMASDEPSPDVSASPSAQANPSVTAPPSEPAPSPSEADSTPGATPTAIATPIAEGPDLAAAGWAQAAYDESGETRTLFVGRLDGRAFEVMTVPSPLLTSGPVKGKVLAMWREGGEMIVNLVDTGDGSSIELARTEDSYSTAALDPSGDYWYWVPVTDGMIDGLWRRPIAGGDAEPVITGTWEGGFTDIDFSRDGNQVAVSTVAAAGGRDYRILDIQSGHLSEILGTRHRSPVGFLGDELIVYSAVDSSDEELQFPLIAIDPADASQRVIVDGEGTFAVIYPGADGGDVLVYQGHEGDDYALYALADGDEEERLLYIGGRPLSAPPAEMVLHSVEVPGWMPVFPFGRAYLWPGVVEEPIDVPRRLVNLGDGSVIEVPVPAPEPEG